MEEGRTDPRTLAWSQSRGKMERETKGGGWVLRSRWGQSRLHVRAKAGPSQRGSAFASQDSIVPLLPNQSQMGKIGKA